MFVLRGGSGGMVAEMDEPEGFEHEAFSDDGEDGEHASATMWGVPEAPAHLQAGAPSMDWLLGGGVPLGGGAWAGPGHWHFRAQPKVSPSEQP